MRRLPVVLGAAALLVLSGGPALAEEPFRVPEQVTDEAGVLVGDTGAVEDAVEQLQADEGIQLWVVYVDTFDGIDPADWTAETYELSDFGDNDVLFAVAVEDRAYDVWVPQDFEQSDAEIQDVLSSDGRASSVAARRTARSRVRAGTTARSAARCRAAGS